MFARKHAEVQRSIESLIKEERYRQGVVADLKEREPGLRDSVAALVRRRNELDSDITGKSDALNEIERALAEKSAALEREEMRRLGELEDRERIRPYLLGSAGAAYNMLGHYQKALANYHEALASAAGQSLENLELELLDRGGNLSSSL